MMADSNPRQAAEDHFYTALDLFAEGKFEEAVAEYRTAIEHDPTFIDAMHGLARAYQDMDRLDIRIVVNRAEKGLFRAIKPADVQRALGRSVAFTVVNDHETMIAAIERGVPVAEIRRKGPLARDLDTLTNALVETLGVES